MKVIGTSAYCWDCAEGFLEPIRLRLESIDRARDLQRADLLHPSWLKSDEGLPRYDNLSELDKRVWNATRGQTSEPQSIAAWAKAIAQAEEAELITTDEAQEALASYERRRQKDLRG